MQEIREISSALRNNIAMIIKGKEEQIDKIIIATLCGGTYLIRGFTRNRKNNSC